MIRVSAPTLRADARARGVLVHRIQTPAVLLAVRVAAVAAFLPPGRASGRAALAVAVAAAVAVRAAAVDLAVASALGLAVASSSTG